MATLQLLLDVCLIPSLSKLVVIMVGSGLIVDKAGLVVKEVLVPPIKPPAPVFINPPAPKLPEVRPVPRRPAVEA